MTRFPSFLQRGRAALLIDMIRAFRGRSYLPVYEFSENDVEQPNRAISPRTAQPTTEFPVSAWRLAHAVEKADCACWSDSQILWPAAIGFLLGNIKLFDWNSKNLRLGSGMSGSRADFSRTSLSGRIGQGMALLFLENWGYSYLGRFTTLYPQCGGDSETPDFVVENRSGEQALAESKGGFMRLNGSPRIKSRFRKALTQLRGGHKCLSSGADRGFAIGTFLREIEDRKYPSLTAYVETDLGKPQGSVGLPPDAVRRANYAAWFSMMGLDGAAGRLRARAGEPERLRVPLFKLEEDTYVIAITSIRSPYQYDAHAPDLLQRLIRARWRWLINPYDDHLSVGIVGLDLRVVRALETAIQEPESPALMKIEPRERRIPEEFPGSVFSDGSLIGEIEFSDTKPPAIKPGNIEL